MTSTDALLEPVTALLVDGDPATRRSLKMLLLSQGIAVTGEASNDRDGVRLAGELRPEVVILDTSSAAVDGVASTREITAVADPPAVLVLAAPGTQPPLDALLAGARGFLFADARYDQIAGCVRDVAAGVSAIPPALAARLVARVRELEREERRARPARDLAGLSALEVDVLRLLAAGLGNSSIGRELYISSSTAKQHVAAIVDKLGVQNRVQAAVQAARIGLV